MWVRVLVTLGLCLLIGGGAAGASWYIFQSEPTAQSERATRRSAALVETVVAERGTFHPRFEVLGRVEPSRDVELAPRIDGLVVGIEDAFVPGGIVAANQALVRLDPVDYETVVATREAEVRQVEAELEIEQGRQRVAEQEFELLGEDVDPANRALVLREPQIASIRARLASAQAALRQARLDLERTTVRAPFDAQVLERAVNLGSQVSPGQRLARLVGVDEYWIVASVPLADLRWLRFPAEGETGAVARVHHPAAWPEGVHREARLARPIGVVDDRTRLARVLVIVPDPLGRDAGGPSLVLGSIVRVEIEGRALEGVVRIERDLLRQGDTVWVMEDGELRVREVAVVHRDAEHAYIEDGLDAGEVIVVTNLATVTDGLALRRAEDGDPSGGSEAAAPEEGAQR